MSFEDQVSDILKPGDCSWSATLLRKRMGRPTEVPNLDPDSQIDSKGHMLTLEGTDAVDQESILKLIWQCVRSGQITRAQHLCSEHGLFWLAASLMGVADEFHVLRTSARHSSNSRVDVTARRGNTRKPLWLNTCYDHASRLMAGHLQSLSDQATNTTADGLYGTAKTRGANVAVLEATICAALSNNVPVLCQSPLISNWPEKLWAAVKTHHDRRLSEILQCHRKNRKGHSLYYPGCDESSVEAERKYKDRLSMSAGAGTTGLKAAAAAGTLADLLRCLAPEDENAAQGISAAVEQLWRLQCAIIEGPTALRSHIESFISESDAAGGFSVLANEASSGAGLSRVHRVYAHLLILLKMTPVFDQEQSVQMQSCCKGSDLHAAINRYLDVLIQNKLWSLVASYAVFLPKHERVTRFVSMMSMLPASSRRIGEGGATLFSKDPAQEAREVLNSGRKYFESDMAEITKLVVVGARVGGESANVSRVGAVVDEEKADVAAEASSVLGGEQGGSDSPRAKRRMQQDEALNSSHVSKRERLGDSMWRDADTTAGSAAGRSMLSVRADVSSLLPDAGRGASASVGSAANSMRNVTVDGEDIARMETLRWLCIDEQHRPEAVRQANAFIRDLILSSNGAKTAELHVLLANLLPTDSLAVSMDVYLRSKRAAGGGLGHVPLASLSGDAGVEDIYWASEYSSLRLWYLVSGAMQAVDSWESLKLDFLATQKSLLGGKSILKSSLGRFKPKIKAACARISDSFREVIHYSVDEYEDKLGVRSGILSVCSVAEHALCLDFCHIIESAKDDLLSSRTTDEDGITELDSEAVLELLEKCNAVFALEHSEDLLPRNLRLPLLSPAIQRRVADLIQDFSTAFEARVPRIENAYYFEHAKKFNFEVKNCISILANVISRREVALVFVINYLQYI
jgi:hypothetical protein